MSSRLTEFTVEGVALTWLEKLGCAAPHGSEIESERAREEWAGFGDVILVRGWGLLPKGTHRGVRMFRNEASPAMALSNTGNTHDQGKGKVISLMSNFLIFSGAILATIGSIMVSFGFYYKGQQKDSQVFVAEENRPYVNVDLEKHANSDFFLDVIQQKDYLEIALMFKLTNESEVVAKRFGISKKFSVEAKMLPTTRPLEIRLPKDLDLGPKQSEGFKAIFRMGSPSGSQENLSVGAREIREGKVPIMVNMAFRYGDTSSEGQPYKTFALYKVWRDKATLIDRKME